MSRVAFIMDRFFRKFGMSGKSFIPMMIGTGCSVPGIMSCRTMENERERRIAVITTSFMPCGAKMPVIALVASEFFHGAWWFAPAIYLTGISSIALSGLLLKRAFPFRDSGSSFIMELPAYHMPSATSVMRCTGERSLAFLKKAGTVIVLAGIAVWFLSSFTVSGGRLCMTENLEESILSCIGGLMQNIFEPLGFGYWDAAVATVMGLFAKEEIVGVFGVLYGAARINPAFTSLSALSFMLFNLLCVPCVAAVSAIRREMASALWTLFAVGYQALFAYCVSLCVYRFGLLISRGIFDIYTVSAFIAFFSIIYFAHNKKSPRKTPRHNKKPLYFQLGIKQVDHP